MPYQQGQGVRALTSAITPQALDILVQKPMLRPAVRKRPFQISRGEMEKHSDQPSVINVEDTVTTRPSRTSSRVDPSAPIRPLRGCTLSIFEYKAQRIVTGTSILRGTSIAGSESGELFRRCAATSLARVETQSNLFSEAEVLCFPAVDGSPRTFRAGSRI